MATTTAITIDLPEDVRINREKILALASVNIDVIGAIIEESDQWSSPPLGSWTIKLKPTDSRSFCFKPETPMQIEAVKQQWTEKHAVGLWTPLPKPFEPIPLTDDCTDAYELGTPMASLGDLKIYCRQMMTMCKFIVDVSALRTILANLECMAVFLGELHHGDLTVEPINPSPPDDEIHAHIGRINAQLLQLATLISTQQSKPSKLEFIPASTGYDSNLLLSNRQTAYNSTSAATYYDGNQCYQKGKHVWRFRISPVEAGVMNSSKVFIGLYTTQIEPVIWAFGRHEVTTNMPPWLEKKQYRRGIEIFLSEHYRIVCNDAYDQRYSLPLESFEFEDIIECELDGSQFTIRRVLPLDIDQDEHTREVIYNETLPPTNAGWIPHVALMNAQIVILPV